MILFTVLTALLVLGFLVALAYALLKICHVLESIGGVPTSYLAKLRLGLRAIERETSHLPPQVEALNAGLTAVAGGLVLVDGHLRNTIDAAVKQES